MSQVNLEHYKFRKYVTKERWMSYFYQIEEVLEEKPKTVLIIGKGDSIVENIISKFCDKVDTLDFDISLKPDIFGDVRNLTSIVNEKYDCILCCQVLEHLEWKYFEHIIEELKQICNRKIILSLPCKNTTLTFKFLIPKIKISIQKSIPQFWKKNFQFDGEHYWEVNTNGHTKKKFLNSKKITNNYYNKIKNLCIND